MGVGKIPAALCQRIHVRSDRLRMASEEAGPVVEIVDADHHDIRPRRLGMGFPVEEKRKDGNRDCLNGSDCSSAIHIYLRGAGVKGTAVLLISDSHLSSRSLSACSFSGWDAARFFSSAMSSFRL